jgi:LysR family cyn operon transcriptional activator
LSCISVWEKYDYIIGKNDFTDDFRSLNRIIPNSYYLCIKNKTVELRQIKYFVKAAELLNFTEAAKECFVAESTLWQQIKQLETELDVSLFKRNKRKMELTDAGALFLPHAQRTLASSTNAIQAIKDLQGLHTGTLIIGCTFNLTPMLTGALLAFSQTYPDVRISVVRQSSDELISLLQHGRLDMVLCFEENPSDARMEAFPLFNTSLYVVMHRLHPLASEKTLSLNRIKDYPLALPDKSIYIRGILDNWILSKGGSFTPNLEWNDANLAFNLLKTGHWLTILTDVAVRNEPELTIIPLTGLRPSLKTVLLWMKDGYEKNAIKEFVRLLQNVTA